MMDLQSLYCFLKFAGTAGWLFLRKKFLFRNRLWKLLVFIKSCQNLLYFSFFPKKIPSFWIENEVKLIYIKEKVLKSMLFLTKNKKFFQLNMENYSKSILDICISNNWEKAMPELQISQQKAFQFFYQVLFTRHVLKLAKYYTTQKKNLSVILFLSRCMHKMKPKCNLFFRLETQWDGDHCSIKLSTLYVG